jgi:hypothetical protein
MKRENEKRENREKEKERVINFVNLFFESWGDDIKTVSSELIKTNNKVDVLETEILKKVKE